MFDRDLHTPLPVALPPLLKNELQFSDVSYDSWSEKFPKSYTKTSAAESIFRKHKRTTF